MAAVSTTLLAFLKAGDHLLMVDTAYHPTRQFCDSILKGLNIETTYYDPLIGRGIAGLIRANTKVVYCESPGSQTMEVQDVPAIADVAHKKAAWYFRQHLVGRILLQCLCPWLRCFHSGGDKIHRRPFGCDAGFHGLQRRNLGTVQAGV